MITIMWILIYLLIGLVWKDSLEWYVTRHFEGKMGERFTTREIVFQTLFWPIFLGIFIIEFIKNIR